MFCKHKLSMQETSDLQITVDGTVHRNKLQTQLTLISFRSANNACQCVDRRNLSECIFCCSMIMLICCYSCSVHFLFKISMLLFDDYVAHFLLLHFILSIFGILCYSVYFLFIFKSLLFCAFLVHFLVIVIFCAFPFDKKEYFFIKLIINNLPPSWWIDILGDEKQV